MRILLTNDDGIRAPGIIAMHDALIDRHGIFGGMLEDRTAGTVTRSPRNVVHTVAPATVQSATSHGVTFHMPLIVRDEQVNDRMEGVRRRGASGRLREGGHRRRVARAFSARGRCRTCASRG
jgi:broad specificity polyphosphatase/5'/3'-nucleotidase SurE